MTNYKQKDMRRQIDIARDERWQELQREILSNHWTYEGGRTIGWVGKPRFTIDKCVDANGKPLLSPVDADSIARGAAFLPNLIIIASRAAALSNAATTVNDVHALADEAREWLRELKEAMT